MPRGGARPGSGNKLGVKLGPNKSTISKEMAREALRTIVLRHMDEMLTAQIAHSKGIGHLFTRDKSGKYNKIEHSDEAERLLSQGTEGQDYWIFMKDPSVQAFTDLMNRALDKPKEQEQDINLRGSVDVVDILKRRHAKHRQNP